MRGNRCEYYSLWLSIEHVVVGNCSPHWWHAHVGHISVIMAGRAPHKITWLSHLEICLSLVDVAVRIAFDRICSWCMSARVSNHASMDTRQTLSTWCDDFVQVHYFPLQTNSCNAIYPFCRRFRFLSKYCGAHVHVILLQLSFTQTDFQNVIDSHAIDTMWTILTIRMESLAPHICSAWSSFVFSTVYIGIQG